MMTLGLHQLFGFQGDGIQEVPWCWNCSVPNADSVPVEKHRGLYDVFPIKCKHLWWKYFLKLASTSSLAERIFENFS